MSVSRLLLLTICLALGGCDAVRPSYRLLHTGKWRGALYFEGFPALPPQSNPDVLELDVSAGAEETTGTWRIVRDGISSNGDLTIRDDGSGVEGTLFDRQCKGVAWAHVTGGSGGRFRVVLSSHGFNSRNQECRTGPFTTLLN